MLKAIMILPFNVLISIPALILYFNDFKIIKLQNIYALLVMLILFTGGLTLMIWTIKLFSKTGTGSLAPWNPINKLITTGPYAYVRNPMLLGVFLCLGAESILFQSLPLFYYLLIFIGINMLYFPLSEEKGLYKKYGEEYLEYKRNVPRFIPRLPPYKSTAPKNKNSIKSPQN